MTKPISIIRDTGQFDAQCEALYARAFGPGRYAKAAARLREGNVCRRDMSVVAFAGGILIGACRLWPIVAANGIEALFLGPIAVEPLMRSVGLGKRMTLACLEAVDAVTSLPVLLVGDMSFFGPLGFEVAPLGRVMMPGPVDPKRLLWRIKTLTEPALPKGQLSVPRATSLTD